MITLTTPEDRPSATAVELVSVAINADQKYAEVLYRVGYTDGNDFRVTRVVKLTFTNQPFEPGTPFTYTFQQLVNNVAAVKALKNELESEIVRLGIIDGVLT